jgi:hypothetical protein
MVFVFELEVGEHSKKEIPLQKLVLILDTRPFHEFSDRAQALGHSIVVFNVHKVVLIFLILILQYLPNPSSYIEVGSCRQSTQKYLIGPKISFTKIDKKLEEDKFGWLLATDSVVVGIYAVRESAAFVEGGLLEVDFVEDLFDLHEEVDGVRLIGEVAVENGLDVAVAIVAQQSIEVLQTHEEELAVGDAHGAGLEVVEDRKYELALSHQVADLVGLFPLLAMDEDCQHLHEPRERLVDLACILRQLLESILDELRNLPEEEELLQIYFFQDLFDLPY